MAFHDSVPGHKSPASLRTILRMFRKDALRGYLQTWQALKSWIPKGMCSGSVVCSILGACQAHNHIAALLPADVSPVLTGGQSQGTGFAFQMSTVFLIKNKKMFCASCHVSNKPDATVRPRWQP